MSIGLSENFMSENKGKSVSKKKSPKEQSSIISIGSKYGQIEIDIKQAVLFPYGLLGMPNNTDYVITHFPKPNMEQFKLFQNLNDHELSFAVLPIATNSEIYDQADINEACEIIEIKKDDLLMLAIISVQRTIEEIKVTANIRAPLMIDSARKLGVQYVFPSNKYDIRHVLSKKKNS